MKLKSKTSLLTALVVASSLTLMGWLSFSLLEEALRKSSYLAMEEVAANTAETIHQFLDGTLREAQSVAVNIPLGALESGDHAALEKYLQGMAEVFPKFGNGMFVLDEKGAHLAGYPSAPQERGRSRAFREYFQRTMREGRGLVGRPYRSERNGQPVCTFTAPLKNAQGRVLGMLGCSVRLLDDQALGVLRKKRLGAHGYIYVYDASRMMILHPDEERVLQRDVPQGANSLFDSGADGGEGVGETVNSRGVPMLLAVRQVRGTDWIVGAQEPRDEALELLGGLEMRLVVGVLIGTALAALIGALAISRVVLPVSRLRDAAKAVDSGELSARLAQITGKDEIAELATAFREMAERLNRSMAASQAASRQWEQTFDSVPEAVFLLGKDFKVVRLNRAACKLVGADPAKARGQYCYQLVHQSDTPPPDCPHRQALASGKPCLVEREESVLGGTYEMSATPVGFVEDQPEGSVITIRDITDRKLAEQALSQSEMRYRTLVEQAMDLIVVVQDAKVVFANRAAKGLLEWSPEEMVGKGPELFYHPEDLPKVMDRYLRRVAGHEPENVFQARVLTKSGRTKWIELASQNVEWSGRPAMQVVFRDISERHLAQVALVQSEERYRSLVENVPYGLCITEMETGRFLFLNQIVCDIFGYTMEEASEMTIWDISDPVDHPRMRQRLQMHLKHQAKTLGASVYTGLRKDGGRFRYEATVSLVHHQGRYAMQGIIRDVTAQEMLEHQLQHAQKMEAVGTMAGGVAHEFNNILMALRGYTQLLLQLEGLPDKAMEYLGKIQNSSNRAAEMTSRLLTFSRLETGGRQNLRLEQVVREVAGLLSQTLPPNLEIKVDAGRDAPQVRANANQMEQVVLNLALNARDAMAQGGTLTISTSRESLDQDFCATHPWAHPGEYAVITVTDTGEGMSPEVLEHVFEPFFTTKEPGRGTGLGLALAYSMVGNHGGGLLASSQPGQGSSFKVYLPVSRDQAMPAAGERPRQAPAKGQGQAVLVVDDEPSLREVASESLAQHGYRVAGAANGQEALEAFVKARQAGDAFQVVILDLAMPVMDGLTCLERLLVLDPQAKVIVATGHGAEASPGGWADKVAGVLRKPFDLHTLLAEVARLVQPPA